MSDNINNGKDMAISAHKKSDEIEFKTDCFFFYMDKPDSHCINIECCRKIEEITGNLWFPSFDCKDCEYYISHQEAYKIIDALVNTK